MVSWNFMRRLLVLWAGFAAGMTAAPSLAQDAPIITEHGWSFDADGPYPLRDGWTVYRDQLLPPESFTGTVCQVTSAAGEAVSAPDIWGPGFTFNISSGHGMATYCRRLRLPDAETFYSLRTGTLRSVSHIYAVYTDQNGQRRTQLLQDNGDLDSPADQVVNNPAVPNITLPYGVTDMLLVMQLSNRIHKQGGMVEVPKLDLKWRMDAAENRATALPSALVICLLLVAIAALGLGRRSTHVVDHRLFAFMAFAAAFRAAFVSDLIWDYFPAFSLARKYDLEYLSLFVIAVAYYAFVNRLLRPGRVLKIDLIIYATTGSLIAFAIFLAPFFPPGTITLTREPIQIVWSVIILMVVYSVFHTTIRVPEQRREAIVVSLAALTYAAYEILSATGFIASSLEWSQFIIFVVVMMHAHAFVIKANRTEFERDMLTARLQDTNRDLQNRALALDLALKRAEEASKAKSNFLATFSHELRTPLNAIIGFSELIEREVFGAIGSKHYKGYIVDINSSGRHLLSLVDDILDLSRIEAGADEVLNQKVDVCALIEETFSLVKIQAEDKKINLSLDQALEVPLLTGDERKLKQVLINLVTNAIKYNKQKGDITVNVHADETGLYVDVMDTGVGIAAEDIPVVMSRFGQAESARRSENSGVGIGLPLSELLMRQHGGRLKLTSELGKGTCVALWFPAERLVREEEVA